MKISASIVSLRRYLAGASAFVAIVVATACVSTTPPEGVNDPSSAHAETAAAPTDSPVLDEGHAPIGDVADSTETQSGEHDHASHSHAAHDTAAHNTAQHGDAKPHAPVYVCPMHPEVRQAEPGRCPKCGMPLEVEAPKAETKE